MSSPPPKRPPGRRRAQTNPAGKQPIASPSAPESADDRSGLPEDGVEQRRRHRAAERARRPAVAAIAESGFLTGQLLIAMPAMADPRFAQSVIYVCAHTSEGAMGIVLNRPLEQPSFDDLLRQLDVAPTPPARRVRLCAGGPVDHARGFVLHTTDWTGDGSLRVDDGMALTASLDVLKAIAGGGGPTYGLLALGYAGWGPGQLDDEMQKNAWLSAPAPIELVFDADHESKWRRALATLKIDPLLLSGVAGHA